MIEERVELTKSGKINEITCAGGAQLERLGKNFYFLEMTNLDGSSTAIWIHGKLSSFEQREIPNKESDLCI